MFGASNDALTWSALAYLDDQLSAWGLYTPNPAHIGGVAEVGALRLGTGAQAGYVLTSDAAGNASWQTPAGGGADGGLAGRRHSRRHVEEASSEADQAVAEFNSQLEAWDRNYAACMGGKDDTVE